ncbi:MAG: hypothetical protein M4D85_09640 [Actinomycetota bacterium]|nr:hypothetical protein [Actinomycetota bacterium]
MTEPQQDTSQPPDDIDVSAEPPDTDELPASSDPSEFSDDQELGGVGGGSPGGAG